MEIIYNQELKYKDICQMMNDSIRDSGRGRDRQLRKWQKSYDIEKPRRGRYVIKRELTSLEKFDKTYIKRYDIQLQEFAEKRHINILSKTNEFTQCTDIIKYECECHKGVIQESKVYNLLQSIGCPLCTYPMSRFEVMLHLGLKDSLHRKQLDGVEYDIILPKDKIAVEVDGYLYHSGENEVYKEQKKFKIAQNNGYSLIKIYEQNCMQSRKIYRNGNKLYIIPYSIANKKERKQIISLVQEILPYKHSDNLWNKAADYMRDWKYKQYNSHVIKQYDNNDNLIAEFESFEEIKKLIGQGNAFGFNWIIGNKLNNGEKI